jgi:hypothetical protein
MEDVGVFYGHLVQFTVFCYILWTLGLVRGNLVCFFPFRYFVPRKIRQPWSQLGLSNVSVPRLRAIFLRTLSKRQNV